MVQISRYVWSGVWETLAVLEKHSRGQFNLIAVWNKKELNLFLAKSENASWRPAALCLLTLQSDWQRVPVWRVLPGFPLSEGFSHEPCGKVLCVVTSHRHLWIPVIRKATRHRNHSFIIVTFTEAGRMRRWTKPHQSQHCLSPPKLKRWSHDRSSCTYTWFYYKYFSMFKFIFKSYIFVF